MCNANAFYTLHYAALFYSIACNILLLLLLFSSVAIFRHQMGFLLKYIYRTDRNDHIVQIDGKILRHLYRFYSYSFTPNNSWRIKYNDKKNSSPKKAELDTHELDLYVFRFVAIHFHFNFILQFGSTIQSQAALRVSSLIFWHTHTHLHIAYCCIRKLGVNTLFAWCILLTEKISASTSITFRKTKWKREEKNQNGITKFLNLILILKFDITRCVCVYITYIIYSYRSISKSNNNIKSLNIRHFLCSCMKINSILFLSEG